MKMLFASLAMLASTAISDCTGSKECAGEACAQARIECKVAAGCITSNCASPTVEKLRSKECWFYPNSSSGCSNICNDITDVTNPTTPTTLSAPSDPSSPSYTSPQE